VADDPSALDPRQVRTRAKVLAAARAVLRRDGAAATIDAIATEAGVARSTLYRNWTSREDLLADAIEDAGGPAGARGPTAASDADAGPVRAQLVMVVVELAHALDRSEWGRTLPAIVAAVEGDAAFAERYRAFTDERRRAVERLVARGVRSGELHPSVPVGDLIDALVGPLFYRRLIRSVPTSAAWARRHATRVLATST
jgi:AcrR family transcriptional regulator